MIERVVYGGLVVSVDVVVGDGTDKTGNMVCRSDVVAPEAFDFEVVAVPRNGSVAGKYGDNMPMRGLAGGLFSYPCVVENDGGG